MARIEIDDRVYEVDEGGNVLDACLSLGLDLPYFCWHPALGSVGSCRQCAIVQYKDADDRHGRLTMACMTPVTDGMRISIDAETAREFRGGNIELLMINHPHDCPVCEEGGECHLQDMTLMTGHTVRRYRGRKRTHKNQDLGPFINHEMNRCITCYRCVRFYNDYAGSQDLQALGIHNNIYFGRFEDGALESEFSGNLVEVCPTGVFTDRTFSEHYTRKWDLQTAPSICVHCSLGCNISPGERYGELRRVINRYHGDVNGYFLCDRGRFGYGFVNSAKRLRVPRSGETQVSVEAAAARFKMLLNNGRRPIGIGSPRASLEANFALRALVGGANFFLGLEENERSLLDDIQMIMADGGIHAPSLHEIEQADAVLVLGEDVTHSAPRMALSLRQTVRKTALDQAQTLHIPTWLEAPVRELQRPGQGALYIASLCSTRLDDAATATYRGDPEAIARLGFAVAHYLNGSAPEPEALTDEQRAQAKAIAEGLRQAQRPLVVTGTSSASAAVIQAAYNVAKALPATGRALSFIMPECNSPGLAALGGGRLREAFAAMENGDTDTVVILENDLYRRAGHREVDAFFAAAEQVIVLDSLDNATAAKAELALPVAAFAESEGTLVNNEGRAQRYYPVYAAPLLSSWQWLTAAAEPVQWPHFEALSSACATACSRLAGIASLAGAGGGRKIPRQSHRYSGRTAWQANIQVSEPAPPSDDETPFAFSMEGDSVHVASARLPVFWSPGWNSTQSINKFQDEIGGHLRGGDPGVRLFEASDGSLPWFDAPLPADETGANPWRLIFLPDIFASDELSAQSPPLIERRTVFCVAVSPADAETLAVARGDFLAVRDAGTDQQWLLPVRIEPALPRGWLGMTAGMPDAGPATIRTEITLAKVEAGHARQPEVDA